MKKIRLNLKRGTKEWTFVVYDSVESAVYLQGEPLSSDDTTDYRREVKLSPGETLEAEWLGSEWSYDKDVTAISGVEVTSPRGFLKYDKVRIGKLTPVKPIAGRESAYVELYSGWVVDGTMPWSKDDTRKDVRITPIKGRTVSKLDFSELFYDHLPEEDEDPSELPREAPAVLN